MKSCSNAWPHNFRPFWLPAPDRPEKHRFCGTCIPAAYLSLDLPVHAEAAENAPEQLLDRFAEPLIIDEIQYAPSLLRYLKHRIDADRKPGRFLLTGSQVFSQSLCPEDRPDAQLLGFGPGYRHSAQHGPQVAGALADFGGGDAHRALLWNVSSRNILTAGMRPVCALWRRKRDGQWKPWLFCRTAAAYRLVDGTWVMNLPDLLQKLESPQPV